MAELHSLNQSQYLHPNAQIEDRVWMYIDGPNAEIIGTGDFGSMLSVPHYRDFHTAFDLNERFYYAAESDAGYEVGIGYLTSYTNFVRETIIRSSNFNGLVDFNSNSRLDIYCTVPTTHIRRSFPGRVAALARGLAMP